MSAQRVVTLPPTVTGPAALEHARAARQGGAQLLEVRTDLHVAGTLDPAALAEQLPLVVSQRGTPIPPEWEAAATWIDLDATESALMPRRTPVAPERLLLSHHASRPHTPEQAEAFWRAFGVRAGARLKHVEPLGDPKEAERLFETRRRLRALAPGVEVTVLATGPLALPFRCRLAEDNAFDYLAQSPDWSSAPGQRLLADATREARAEEQGRSLSGSGRLGILGTGISGSRSPRVHPQPFDRLDLPNTAALDKLLPALLPHYRGFAVTSPFKKTAALAVGADLEAVNTLYRVGGEYKWANTDVAGARAVLKAMRATAAPAEAPLPFAASLSLSSRPTVTLLGDGGSSFALRLAALELEIPLKILTRREVELEGPLHLGGPVVWTWPDGIAAPANLSLEGARVAIVAYGAAAGRIAAEISRLGGLPLKLGARWFVAQAREQRAFWEKAT